MTHQDSPRGRHVRHVDGVLYRDDEAAEGQIRPRVGERADSRGLAHGVLAAAQVDPHLLAARERDADEGVFDAPTFVVPTMVAVMRSPLL